MEHESNQPENSQMPEQADQTEQQQAAQTPQAETGEAQPTAGTFHVPAEIQRLQELTDSVKAEIGKVIVGQHEMVELMLCAMLANGHVLIEGIPGVAKTLAAKLLARTIAADFSRVQFTPDLMPSDVLGTSVFNFNTSKFEFRKGPVFSNLVLIDEVNRAPAKTQAALFELMEERQVTMDGETYHFPPPFMVLATQNPIEQEGTYRLPEAQLDRFLFKIEVGYPSLEQEIEIIKGNHERGNTIDLDAIGKVISEADLKQLHETAQGCHVEDKILRFIAELIGKTREHKDIYLGASPRASLALLNGSKALAALSGRNFVTPDDVLYLVKPTLRHRIILSPEKEMDGSTADQVLDLLVETVEVPR